MSDTIVYPKSVAYMASNGRAVCISVSVESSMIQNMQWNNFGEFGEMTVNFWSGDTYIYEDVSLGIFQCVYEAESVGKAFNRLIRDRYEFRRLTNSPVPA